MDFTRLTAYLHTLEERYGVHGLDIKITKEHETVYRCMIGHSDYARTVPVSDRDLYNIYSATKVVTMVGVMQLIEQGRIGLDDPLDRYLPEFAHMRRAVDFPARGLPIVWPTADSQLVPAKNKMLIHDLMSMTAGMSYDTEAEPIRRIVSQTNGTANTRQIVGAMAEMPLLCEPGTRYSYALGHDVLAAVVEVVTGETFGSYMRKNVFEPLGIEEMFYQVPAQEAWRLSAQYSKDRDTGEVKPNSEMQFRFTPNYESGGAGLCTTVDEYSKILEALANGGVGRTGERILTPESIAEMSRNHLNETELADFRRAVGKAAYGYGLGVRTLMDASVSRSPVGEFGWDGAAGAYCLIDQMNHISIFYTQEILGMIEAYGEIHPTLRDLTYEALGQ